MSSLDGRLSVPNTQDNFSQDYLVTAIGLFKSGKIRQARELLCRSVRSDEIESLYRWMYDNLDLFGKTDEIKDQAIVKIRDALVNHSLVADPEINLSACLIELGQLES
jgi:hypothetical protein